MKFETRCNNYDNRLIDRRQLKANMIAHGLSTKDMCNMLSITDTSFYNKINGKFGFTEEEISILISYFGKSIFFTNKCYELRNKKGGTQ